MSGQTSGLPSTTGASGSTVTGQIYPSSGTTGVSSFTTTEHCEQMQAIDENVSKNIIVLPSPLPEGANIDFQVKSTKGVSFPDNDLTPTIVVKFGQPAEVQSVTIPRDKTNGANVLQFGAVFYSPNGNQINQIPIQSNLSPQGDNTKPAHLDSTQIPSTSQVSRIDITVIKTINDSSPKGVVLDVNACTKARTRKYFYFYMVEKGDSLFLSFIIVLDTTNVTPLPSATSGITGTDTSTVAEQTTGPYVTTGAQGSAVSGQTSGLPSTTGASGSTVTGQIYPSSGTTGVSSFTTTEHCEQMQAIDENVSKNIIVLPSPLPEGANIDFQVKSTKGVSFPDNDLTPTIVVKFGQPAEVQSVTIPRDKTNGANVLQFEVVFYLPNGNQINQIPIQSNLSPEGDNTKPAHLDSSQIPSTSQVSRIDITVIKTINDSSPKGVVLDVNACTKARNT